MKKIYYIKLLQRNQYPNEGAAKEEILFDSANFKWVKIIRGKNAVFGVGKSKFLGKNEDFPCISNFF